MKRDKWFTGAMAASLLAVLCCALPTLAPAAIGLGILGGLTWPWLVGAPVLLGVLLVAGKARRPRTHKMDCGCEQSCMSTRRGES